MASTNGGKVGTRVSSSTDDMCFSETAAPRFLSRQSVVELIALSEAVLRVKNVAVTIPTDSGLRC